MARSTATSGSRRRHSGSRSKTSAASRDWPRRARRSPPESRSRSAESGARRARSGRRRARFTGTGIAAPMTTRPKSFSDIAREVVMAVVDISSARSPLIDQEALAQLALTLSRHLTRVTLDGLQQAIGASLEQVGTAIGAERCRLLEFSDGGALLHTHSAGIGPDGAHDAAAEPWLIDRAVRGELLAIARADE